MVVVVMAVVVGVCSIGVSCCCGCCRCCTSVFVGVVGGHTSCDIVVGERVGEHRGRCCTACRCRVRRGTEGGGGCFCGRGCGGGVTKFESSLLLFALF